MPYHVKFRQYTCYFGYSLFPLSTCLDFFLFFEWQSTDDLKSVAVEAVLLLQGKINDDEDDDTVSIRLLVPSKVIGCIIGKSGSIINEIRKRTKADIHISKGEKPKCADANDELVEVGFKLSPWVFFLCLDYQFFKIC